MDIGKVKEKLIGAKKGKNRRRRLLIIGIGLAVVQQLTGINSVIYYGTQLLQEAGFSTNAAVILNILNGVASVAGITVAILV